MSTSVPPPGYQSPPAYEPAETPTAAPSAAPPPGRRTRFPMRSKLLAGGLVLVAAVAAAFVLLGSTNNPVSDPIAQAATLSSTAPGYRMNLALQISGPTLTAPMTGSGSAIVDLRDQAASMSFAIDVSGEPQLAQTLGSTTLNMRMIVERGVLYMNMPAAVMQAIPGLGGKQWLEVDVPKATGVPGAGSLGNSPVMNDPSQMMQYLRASSTNITNDGHQQVDGVTTTHYHAILNLDSLAANVPPSEQAAVQRALSQLQQATGSVGFPVDVWIDSQHLVRRMSMSMSINAGGGTIQEAITADLFDYGPQRQPTTPPGDQVQDLSNLIHVGN